MKYLLTLLLVLVVACSTAKKESVDSQNKVTSTFQGGGIKISYTKDGEFDYLTSTASAPVTSELLSARDEAITLATVKARRQISEFINTEVHSERFIQTVSKSVQEASADSVTDKSIKSKIAYDVRESIKQKSTAILEGTIVENESYDANSRLVIVTVRASKKDAFACLLQRYYLPTEPHQCDTNHIWQSGCCFLLRAPIDTVIYLEHSPHLVFSII